MTETRKNFFNRLDEALTKTDEVIELKERINIGGVGKAIKHVAKHPIGYGLPAGMYTGAASSPEFKDALFGDDQTNLVDKIQNYADWAGVVPVVGDPIDVASAGVDAMQGQYGDMGLRLLAALPFAGALVNPVTKTGAKMLKKTQLPATALSVTDPFNWSSAAQNQKPTATKAATPAKVATPKTDTPETSEGESFLDQVLAQIEAEREAMNKSMNPNIFQAYTREVQQPGVPQIVSGRKQITFEDRVSEVVTTILNEARGDAVKKGADAVLDAAQIRFKKLMDDPKIRKKIQSQISDISPLKNVRKGLRGLFNPAALALGGTALVPLYLASKFGKSEESETTGKSDGKAGPVGLAGTQSTLDAMGVSPFGWLKGFTPALPAITALATRSGAGQ